MMLRCEFRRLGVVGLAGMLCALAACGPVAPPPGGPETDPEGTGVVFAPKDPTHKLVCDCLCGDVESEKGADGQTLDIPASGNCSDLDDIACEEADGSDSKLSECKKKSVPVSAIKLGDLPLELKR